MGVVVFTIIEGKNQVIQAEIMFTDELTYQSFIHGTFIQVV